VRQRARLASRILGGLAAITVLAALIIGLPVLLLKTGGSPIPRHIPSWHQVSSALLRRDDGTLFLGAVRDISWLGWVAFTLATLAEAQAAMRGRQAPRLAGLGGVQNLAGRLIALAALTFSSPAGALLATPPSPAATAAVVTQPPHAPAFTLAALEISAGAHRDITVRSGDCLWTIAAHHLGAGDRYPEIAHLNLGRHMGDGEVFNNPAFILPGWKLWLPAPANGRPIAEQAPLAARHHTGHASRDQYFGQPHPSAIAPSPVADTLSASPNPALSADGGHQRPAPTSSAAPTGMPAAGSHVSEQYLEVYAAGVLTGGLLAALARMRHHQRQNRREGRRIRLPASTAALRTEQRLRSRMPPEHLQALTLRAALSELAAGNPLPGIAGLHVTPGLLEVLLTTPATAPPPAPFDVAPGRQGMCWQLPLPSPAPAQPDAGRDAGDLLPGLVTVGLTGTEGYLLLDLEPLQVTTCEGPASLVDQVLASIAAELATSQLAGWYDLILAGFPELRAVEGRAQTCATMDEALDLLAARSGERARQIAAADPGDIRLRRVAAPDGWGLTLLVSRIAPTPGQMSRLLDLTTPGGICALTAAEHGSDEHSVAPARIHLSHDPDRHGAIMARISPLELFVRPQPLSREDYHALVTLFAAAADPSDLGPDEPPYHAYDTPSWLPLLSAPPATPAQPSDFPEPSGVPDRGNVPEPWDVPEPAGAEPGAGARPLDASHQPEGREYPEPCTAGQDALGVRLPRAAQRSSANLQVSVLGQFTVTSPAGPLQGAQAELVLALALNGTAGLSMSALRNMLGEDPDHPKSGDAVRQLIARTRRQAGQAPDGREWIQHTGGGQYTLHENAILDWARFHALAEQGMHADSPDDLRSALALVRGEPFTGCFPWWLETPLIETVRAEIVDAAETLARLELAAGDPAAAGRAARTALAADRTAEQLWRALMRAEYAAGNLAGVRTAWKQCLDAIQDIAPDGEPHPDTIAVYRELTSRARPHPAGMG
jgi:DNA-binding SARP family transcriptional activator/nucleoid-associated protein YgaU